MFIHCHEHEKYTNPTEYDLHSSVPITRVLCIYVLGIEYVPILHHQIKRKTNIYNLNYYNRFIRIC